MTTHIHMVAVPEYETSLALVLRDTNGLYEFFFLRSCGPETVAGLGGQAADDR